MCKKIFIAAILAIAVMSGSCGFKAFYTPGSLLKSEIILDSPAQDSQKPNYFKVGDDIELCYFTQGEGRPVLMIHGGPGIPAYKAWEGLSAVKGFKFYYYHQRGCGNSTYPITSFPSSNYFDNMMKLNSELGMGAQLADIERIRRILGEDKLILIGHSYGGLMAVLYAVEFPRNADKLILVSPANTLRLPAPFGMDQIRKQLSPERQKEYDKFVKEYFDYGNLFKRNEQELAVINTKFNFFYADVLKQKGIDIPTGSAEIKGAGGFMVHGIYFSMGDKYDYRKYLNRIISPVLIIHGEKDIYPLESLNDYKDYIPHSQLSVFKNAGHFAYSEAEEEFAGVVENFLNSKE